MSSRIASTSWPSVAIDDRVKALFDRMLTLMDDPAVESGVKLAAEIFLPDATFVSSAGEFRGSEGKSRDIVPVKKIKASRIKAWELVESRYHKIVKVYAATVDGSDLLFLGNARLGLKNGKSIEGDFIGRAVIQNVQGPTPKLSLFQAWGDSGPMTRALQ